LPLERDHGARTDGVDRGRDAHAGNGGFEQDGEVERVVRAPERPDLIVTAELLYALLDGFEQRYTLVSVKGDLRSSDVRFPDRVRDLWI
jgi:hypothetical protein